MHDALSQKILPIMSNEEMNRDKDDGFVDKCSGEISESDVQTINASCK